MLKFENVSTFYGKIQALHSVNVEINQGEIVTLIGANGAGKSTLLMTLCGSPQAHSGSIKYLGEELVGQPSSHIMRKSIAVVPEGRRVFARLTVEENLAMGGFFTDKDVAVCNVQVTELQRVHHVDLSAHRCTVAFFKGALP